jgi:hypothetical protein
MKLKLTVILATFVVTMGLLLGTSAAQETTVIFENGTLKAIGIRNLDFDGKRYHVEFYSDTLTSARVVYGNYPGKFVIEGYDPTFAAIDAVHSALNMAGAKAVGAEGAPGLPFFRVGYESADVFEPPFDLEVVFYHQSWYDFEDMEWEQSAAAQNSCHYTIGTGAWAKFTEESEGLTIIFEGSRATGIRNLEVDGKLYDVEFRYDSAENVYGADPIFDFTEDDIGIARQAMIDALNTEPAVTTVAAGPTAADDNYAIGYTSFAAGQIVSVAVGFYDDDANSWIDEGDYLVGSTWYVTWALFSEVP